ncbi:epoxyqueuosine reductase QueH, partial [Patescibacteria group bacterium]
MKEKLLLHVCCAPCSIYVINQLLEQFDLTVYFTNSNIFPEEEYLQRLSEIRGWCKRKKIKYIEEDYLPKNWFNYVKGYEQEPEKGDRCHLCFSYRLNKVGQYAAQNGFDWFSTTLTMGRQKNSWQIIKIGREIETKHRIRFWAQDFKKSFGTQISD